MRQYILNLTSIVTIKYLKKLWYSHSLFIPSLYTDSTIISTKINNCNGNLKENAILNSSVVVGMLHG